MTSSPSLCRLCLTTCNDDFKRLYDEYGQANSLYEMTYEYFHPKIVDLKKAKHLTAICLQCFHHLYDFHSFQTSVTLAQLELIEEVKTIYTKAEEIENREVCPQTMAVKVEKADLIGFTPDYVVGKDCPQIMKHEIITLRDLPINLQPPPSTTRNNNPIIEPLSIRGIAIEDHDKKDNIYLPALEITDVESNSSSTTVEEIPLAEVDVRKHNNESTRLLHIHEDEDGKDSPTLSKIDLYPQPMSEDNNETTERLSIQSLSCPNDDEEEDRKDNISLPPLEIMDVNTDSSFISDDEIPLALVDSRHPGVPKSRSSDGVPIQTIDNQKSSHAQPQKYLEFLESLLAKWIPDINCFKCSKSFPSWRLVKSHFKRRHPNETFYYICCSRKFTRFFIKDHLRLHGDPDAFKCSICDMRYKTGTSLRFHYAEKHPESLKIQCDKCGKHCTSKSGLSTHQRQRHKSDGQDLPDPQVASTSHCPDAAVNQTTDDQKSSGDQLGNTHETLENLLAKWIPNIKCFECSKRFSSWSLVKSHFKRRHPNEKFYYKCCSRKFYHKVIKDHLSLHSDPDAFKCSICGKRYSSRTTLSAHNAETHTESSKFQCDKCGKRFMSKHGLATHHNLVHRSNRQGHAKFQTMANGRTAYNCQLCGETKYSKASFREHKLRIHGFNTSKVACTICGQGCLNARTFREHMASHKKQKLYQCAFCPKTYISLNTIKNHRKRHHPLESGTEYYTNIGENINEQRDGDSESENAGNQTVTKGLSSAGDDTDSSSGTSQSNGNYNDETLENLLAKWMPVIKCVKCLQSFSRLQLVRQHFTHYHPNEEFYIECCSRQLSERSQLKDHLRLHSDPMVFICELCGNDYEHSSTLKRHQNEAHPQRLKSTCNLCGKVCNSRSHLEDHYRYRHNSNNKNRALIGLLPDGRTTYTCKLCGLTKYSGATFRKHRSLVHSTNDDSFVCSVCGKNCKTNRYLREHMAYHLKTKLYKCAFCPGTYRTRDAVYKHRKKYHPLKSSIDGYVVISENAEDEKESKRNEMSCNTTDSAAAPSTSKSAADRKMNVDDEHNYLNSEDDVSQDGDRNISSLTDVKHISLPELTIMDVNSEFITDDEIPLAERVPSKRKLHKNYQTSEDDISSDSDSIVSNDDDDENKLKNKSRPRPQILKTSDHLGHQQRHSESENKFACKRCQKQFVSQKGLAVHSTRIHKTRP